MTDKPAPISDIKDPQSIRVMIYINDRAVTVPLNALLKYVQAEIDSLDARVTTLEAP